MAQKSLLKSLLVVSAIIMIVFLFPSYSFCEIQTITHTVKQPFGGSQSPDDARIAAVAKAKREALEMAGVYVEALTIVKDAKVDKDEVLALTAGVLQAEVISQKNYHTDDAFGIEVIVKVKVDTSILEDRVKKMLQDKTHIQQLKQAQSREKVLLDKVAKLEKENQLTKIGKSTSKLRKQFQQASRGLTATDWYYKAVALWSGGKYTDPKKAIEYLNNTINLQPDYAIAYNDRGIAYEELGQYQRAIEDYNRAVRLKPDLAGIYYNRGGAFSKLGQNHLASEDFTKAITLHPDYAAAYHDRGVTYAKHGQYQLAIEDYNEAIRLAPDLSEAYSSRGAAYGKLGQYHLAIEDSTKAIGLQPDYVMAYNIRGASYSKIGQHQLAIEDFTTAIRLKPSDYEAESYHNRGLTYEEHGQYQRAIEDFNKAINLKPDYAGTYYERGLVYHNLGQYQRAIEDYNEAIRLKQDYAKAYYNRGVAYFLQGKNNLGCRDAQKACLLGDCELAEIAKGRGTCR